MRKRNITQLTKKILNTRELQKENKGRGTIGN